jgi:ribosome biogenesis protein Tsr3
VWAAYHLMGRSTDGLLDHFRWGDQFIADNAEQLGTS